MHAQNGHPKLSVVAEHAMTGHDVVWSAKIIERTSKRRVRRIKKALTVKNPSSPVDVKTIRLIDKTFRPVYPGLLQLYNYGEKVSVVSFNSKTCVNVRNYCWSDGELGTFSKDYTFTNLFIYSVPRSYIGFKTWS